MNFAFTREVMEYIVIGCGCGFGKNTITDNYGIKILVFLLSETHYRVSLLIFRFYSHKNWKHAQLFLFSTFLPIADCFSFSFLLTLSRFSFPLSCLYSSFLDLLSFLFLLSCFSFLVFSFLGFVFVFSVLLSSSLLSPFFSYTRVVKFGIWRRLSLYRSAVEWSGH